MLENYLEKRKKRSINEFNHTPKTLLIALFAGVCAFITGETTLPDLMELWGRTASELPAWQIHMGSACIGIAMFITSLFVLGVFETKSRRTAWRLSAPWLPLVALTLWATIEHISLYIVILAGAVYGGWAYRQTCRVRRFEDTRNAYHHIGD